MITRAKGTRDILHMRLFNFVIDTIKTHLLSYNFTQIDTPLIEPAALFIRSLGTHTDVVSKELFYVTGGNNAGEHAEHETEQLCLRPEATASVVRAFVNEHVQQTPWKVFVCGPMFRHERPQKGRYRQFYQVNMEIIGARSVATDAQFIALLDQLFSTAFQLNTYALHINYLGCPDDRIAYVQQLQHFLKASEHLICSTCVHRTTANPLRIFDCKQQQCKELYQKAPFITDALCAACTSEWQQLQSLLGLMAVSFQVNPCLVRGLDYYQKTVFEFVSADLGSQNAFCGGGRYDQLVREIGHAADQPSIGAAIGIDRLLMLLEPMHAQLPIPELKPLIVIVPLSEQQHAAALLLAQYIYSSQYSIELLTEGGSIKSMMRKANTMGAGFVLIIGSDEQETGTVTVKNMKNGTEQRVNQKEVKSILCG